MMESADCNRVDLQQLKDRLAKLGVHIQDPLPLQDSGDLPQETVREHSQTRRNKTLAQLLGRCTRVQQVIRAADVDCQDSDADRTGSSKEGAAATHFRKERTPSDDVHSSSRSTKAKRAGALHLPPNKYTGHVASSRPGLAHAGVAAAADSTPEAGLAAVAAAATSDSKLLVRAAQRLLEDAQEDAQQVSRSLKAAAARSSSGGGLTGTKPAAAAAASSCKSSSLASQAAAAAASVEDLRSSPLGTVLAQYKEAQSAWVQDKAKLRREAVAARKEASQVRLELAKVSRSSEHRAQEVSCLKAALKGRDVLLEELQGRVRALEDELAQCQAVAADRLVSISRERDDLQALLLATLERLEGVEAVVAATSTAMEDKVRVLEAERLAALQAAAAARQEVSDLQEARQRLEWQSQLLEKLSKVQLNHTKRKSDALKQLLATTEEEAADGHDTADGVRSEGARLNHREGHERFSQATATLQQLLDELLSTSETHAAS